MAPTTLEILTNREVIAINQDPLGIEAIRIWKVFVLLGDVLTFFSSNSHSLVNKRCGHVPS